MDINPSSSSTVIGYLSRDEEYALKLAMCNEAGCSPGTGTVLVAGRKGTRVGERCEMTRGGEGGVMTRGGEGGVMIRRGEECVVTMSDWGQVREAYQEGICVAIGVGKAL